MKKWIDANLIAECTEVERKHWEFEKMMKEKPNFNKNEIKDKKRNKKKLNIKNKKKGVK